MSETFMDLIYRGGFDERSFRLRPPSGDTERVRRIVRRYREILEDFPEALKEVDGGIPGDMLKAMGRIGLFGVSLDESYGGLGFNICEYTRLVEELVTIDISLAMAPLAHCSIGTKGISLFGTEAQKRKYLTPASSGEMIFAYALTEPRTGSDAQHIETSAVMAEDGAGYIVNGEKAYITNANYAGGLTVFARMNAERPGYLGAFIVETAWEGVEVGRDVPKMGLKASSTAPIRFRNVRVPAENLLGAPGAGFRIAMTVLNHGRLALGAASVGMMERSLQDMIKRASTRVQFQRPIRDFPLIREKLVETRVNACVSRAVNDLICGMLHEDPRLNVAVETSHCKLFGTTRAWRATYDALQVAGGAGYLSTLPYEKRMRDFRVASVFEGTTEIHSIYPALYGMRGIENRMKRTGAGPMSRVRSLLSDLLRKPDWPLRFEERPLRQALKLCRANARRIRAMLAVGLVFYGKKLFEKEFFLRRITGLSLYLFGLLALLAKVERDRRSRGISKEDIDILCYFLEEAKAARKADKSFFDSRREALGETIFKSLPGAPSDSGHHA